LAVGPNSKSNVHLSFLYASRFKKSCHTLIKYKDKPLVAAGIVEVEPVITGVSEEH
jgi:hypothetical protein